MNHHFFTAPFVDGYLLLGRSPSAGKRGCEASLPLPKEEAEPAEQGNP